MCLILIPPHTHIYAYDDFKQHVLNDVDEEERVGGGKGDSD